MSPALIPNPETYEADQHPNVKTKWVTAPDGNCIAFDNFSKLKAGQGLDKYRHRDSAILEVFGCKSCRWINTKLCPHSKDNGGSVTHMKHHAKGICSQRLSTPILLHNEGLKMTGENMKQVQKLMDSEYFSLYKQKQAEDGKCDINDCFPWEKLGADILKEIRKQNEGSRIISENRINPSDINDLLRNAKEVDVEVVGKSLENDSDDSEA